MKIIEFFQQHLALAISAAFGLIGILHFSVVIGEITPLIIIGEPVDPREPYLSESSQTKLFLGDAVIAAWRTELNPQSLVGLELAGLPMTTALSRDTPPRLSGQVVAVDLPGGLDGLQLHVDTIWEHSNGGITYAGRIEAEVAWLFTLTIEKSTILGRLHLDDRLFLLHSSSESQLILYEIDISRIPQSQHIYEDADAAQGTSLLSSSPDPIPCSGYSPNNDNGNVRVLFLYSPNISSGITTLINNIVAQFNQSAINSGVDIKNYLTVANTRQISSNLDGLCRGGIEDSEDGVINRMRLGNSPFSNLTQWMSNDHADIAFTIQSLMYSGPGTWASHLGPGYFRVRACNGSGCGSWSSSVSAEYFDGCL